MADRNLNRRLVILELGEGFKTPTVMRWPFEKIVFSTRNQYFTGYMKPFSRYPRKRESGPRESRQIQLPLSADWQIFK